jgi:stage III sporulation protein SpoIIIAA
MPITNELQKLLEILPLEIRQILEQHPQQNNLIEIVMDLGRRPEARFQEQSEYLTQTPVTRQQLNYCIQRVKPFNEDNRVGIEQTLHRISAIRNRSGKIIGLTCRVGRAIYGTINMIYDLVQRGQSLLILGRPGVGKTTVLREIARVLADELNKRVIIVDTSNEIAGDGDIPHPAIGRARRMQVPRPELQYRVMIEAVENHMPEVIVIDEIGTELEVRAARSIAERGVQLVGTAHGNSIENLIKNPTLSDLVGGIQSVILGDEEAKRRHTQKSVLERKAPPTFEIAVEMRERHCWVVHESVPNAIDSLLRGHQPSLQVRTMNERGQVTITREFSRSLTGRTSQGVVGGTWFGSLRTPSRIEFGGQPFTKMLPAVRVTPYYPEQPNRWHTAFSILPLTPRQYREGFEQSSYLGHQQKTNGEELPLHIYPYSVSRHKLELVIKMQNLPVMLTQNIEDADVILTLPSHSKKDSKLQHLARRERVPIYLIEASTIANINRALRQLLYRDKAIAIDDPEQGFLVQPQA